MFDYHAIEAIKRNGRDTFPNAKLVASERGPTFSYWLTTTV